ncbi:hypothetical protein QR674_12580 [Acinetobacter chinensis]|uniref:Uncharacterized protein n=1 Tax=Acinetobacter chinensis TaxID=2004650 RepID=A0ABU3WHF4_9GAMM|nr:hypothetical protein [Acinetobacter chinensis]MDV2469816.1 hypothetical protein [Acinetobacter chinensis]
MNTSSKSVHPVRTRLHPEFIGPVHPREVLQHVLQQTQQKQPSPGIKIYLHPAITTLLFTLLLTAAFLAGGNE